MDEPLKKSELEQLNTEDPDEVVEFIENFYNRTNIHNEKELVRKLSKYKPLRSAIELQKGKNK